MNDEELTVLREIRDAVQHLCRLMESQVEYRRAAPVAMAQLLQEVRRAASDQPFTVNDLTLNATLTLVDDETLYRAIVQAAGCFSTRRLGNVLAEIEGRDFGGLTVQRSGRKKTRDGTLWKIVTSKNGKSSR
jgi:hypothetical protein